MRSTSRWFVRQTRGQTAVEYALLAAAFMFFLIAVASTLQDRLGGWYEELGATAGFSMDHTPGE